MSNKPGAGAPKLDFSHLRGGVRRLARILLRDARAGDPKAIRFFEELHPRFDEVGETPKLADAQLVVARMLGYRSWPQLKHHRAVLDRAQREIDEGAPAPDGGVTTVHVRCGSDIQTRLTDAGYVGAFVEFADPLCQGPVPAGDQDALLTTRASFVAHAYELELEACQQRVRAEWDALRTVDQYDRVVLWFEHDSYDQLTLAAALSTLRAVEHPRVELICVDEYPGRPGFRGLGELGKASLRGLWERREPVTEPQYRLADAVWNALRAPDPRALFELCVAGTPAIGPMAGALRRHLMELPWVGDGLSLTQRLILEAVRAGVGHAGSLCRTVNHDLEPLPFLGDTMLWWEIRELAAGGAVRLTPNAEGWRQWAVELTDWGEALLRESADWVEAGRRPRWVGGIVCGPGRAPWRWDPQRGRPVRSG